MKKYIVLKGYLLRPLKEGTSAIIMNDGVVIRTSRVVDILSADSDEKIFETMNTVYRVVLETVPVRAALPKLCA